MGSFDIKAIRKTIDEEYNKKEKTKTIELKNNIWQKHLIIPI